MTNTQELQNLLERVERAQGPDRELDTAIAFVTCFRPDEKHDRLGSFAAHEAKHGYAAAWIAHRPWHGDWSIPVYTTSIDAALALVQLVLPGSAYVLNAFRVATKPDDVWMFKCHLSDGCSGIADGRTQALAVCAALLKALIAQADEVAACA